MILSRVRSCWVMYDNRVRWCWVMYDYAESGKLLLSHVSRGWVGKMMHLSRICWWQLLDIGESCKVTLSPDQRWHAGPNGMVYYDVESCAMMTCWTEWNDVLWRWVLCSDDMLDRMERCTMQWWHAGPSGTVYDDIESCAMTTWKTRWNSVRWRWVTLDWRSAMRCDMFWWRWVCDVFVRIEREHVWDIPSAQMPFWMELTPDLEDTHLENVRGGTWGNISFEDNEANLTVKDNSAWWCCRR